MVGVRNEINNRVKTMKKFDLTYFLAMATVVVTLTAVSLLFHTGVVAGLSALLSWAFPAIPTLSWGQCAAVAVVAVFSGRFASRT